MSDVHLFPDVRRDNILQILEELMERATKGEIASLEIVVCKKDGDFETQGSATSDRVLVGAMLIKLGMRRLGVCE